LLGLGGGKFFGLVGLGFGAKWKKIIQVKNKKEYKYWGDLGGWVGGLAGSGEFNILPLF
jgi:hypothetical protein